MKVAGYIRVSTEEQALNGKSLKMQRDSIKAFAQSQGWELVKIYEDDGYSATTLHRPALQELLKDIKDSKWSSLLVYRIDRLTRHLKHLLELVELLEKNEIGFTSVTESFNTQTPNGKLVLHILGTVAEWERATIAKRTQDTLENLARNGKHIGRPPLGFKANGNGLTIDETALKTFRLISKLRGQGRWKKSYREVASELNDQKIPTIGGGCQWNASTLHYILNNPTLKGYVRFKNEQFEAKHRSLFEYAVQ